MKKLRGLNEIVATLVQDQPLKPGDPPPKPPTFKEVALNVISMYRPKEESQPAERVKVTKLGMIFLTATDTLEMEDEYYEVFKKIVNQSKLYAEFILGQWTERFNRIDLEAMDDKSKKDKK